MDNLLTQVGEHLVPILFGVCFVVAILLKSLTTIVTHQSHEKSRREIAAYIAEGSLTPEQGERLLKADAGKLMKT